ncbi:hypothetical protein H9650_00115 [Psychrobacillus sp. Sa2BUA9]|uniref:Uncharacterized protein n=1 Tax=Psychrobacillus faecigallinarum TaxID=2762235 RepID=A0ABR8R414_9BACI|nr:hypothetical protein [Psychrobacillus faecigallinarum]MBD7942515.1 hypothetical protein [Psychrobacillus faecigallinarum]
MSTIKGLSEKNRNLLFELVKEIKAEGYAEGFEAGKSSLGRVEEKSPQVAGTTSGEQQKKVLNTLADWIIRTVNKNDLATPEEIEALPKVAEVYFRNYSSVSFSPVRRR